MNLYFEKETEEAFIDQYEEIARKVITRALSLHHCPYECEISIYLVDEDTIRETNAATREIDKVTDVLSFPNVFYEKEGDFGALKKEEDYYTYFNPDTNELILGEMMICQNRVLEQALEYGHSVKREYAFLVAHSILHLLGYDHIEEQERNLMEEKQSEILNSLGITRTVDKE